jgi:threonine dehydrogenase-like Zn-dependent dehydrogenase
MREALRWELTGAGLESFGRDGKPSRYEVAPPGRGELLARVDACGICFSDIKILNLGGDHPRLRGRDLTAEPVVMGHEVSLTVLDVGREVQAPFRPGDRAIVQADVYYGGQGMAMGYRLPGGFSQYVRIGREILEGDEGCYLLPVPATLGYAEAALCEPWACVEAAYRYEPRRSLRAGGSLLVALARRAEAERAVWPAEPQPGSLTLLQPTDGALPAFPSHWPDARRIGVTSLQAWAQQATGERFDDIVLLGEPTAAEVEALLPLLANGGLLNLVGRAPDEPVSVDVGRNHYEDTGIVGTEGREVGRAYEETRGAELTPGGVAWFIGAGGPMGQMHLQRSLSLPRPPRAIVATQNTGPRYRDLLERFSEPAGARGVALTVLNPKELPEEELYARLRDATGGRGFDDIVCLVPSIPALERASELLAHGGGVNLFAGVPVGTKARLDLGPIVSQRVRYWGTSGSKIADLASVVDKLAAGDLETAGVVAAVSGIHGVREGLAAVREGRFLGKTVIYPHLEALPLLSVAEVAERYSTVGARLTRGRYWNREAEAELFRLFGAGS